MFARHEEAHSGEMELIALAQGGDREALEKLVREYQGWIYNLAWRMVGSPQDAEDVAQEALIKIVTKLSTFQGRSSFRTWVYRIVVNHVIGMRRKPWEQFFHSFEQHGQVIALAPDMELPDQVSLPVDISCLIEETRLGCMTGMLLCLDREQRLVFIFGGVLGVGSEIGAEIMETSPENFRQILARARKQLANYMAEKCGLMDAANPCNCARKTKAAIAAGYVDPRHLLFYREHVQKVKTLVAQNADRVDDLLEFRAQTLFQEQPFLEPPDYASIISSLLKRDDMRWMLDP